MTGCTLRLARDIGLPASTSENPSSPSTLAVTTALSISPTSKNLMVGNSATFSASGGTQPYTFSLLSGIGTVDSSSGLYTAPGSMGTASVRVTDAAGQTSDATLTIFPALQMTPSSMSMTAANLTSASFSASGGVPPLNYSIFSGPGSIQSSSGLYTATTQSGSSSVRVTDAVGNSVSGSVQNNRIRVGGHVYASAYANGAWYIGGSFDRVNPIEAPYLAVLDSTGSSVFSCDLKAGFNDSVLATAISGNSLYVGGNFSTYQGQPAKNLAKLNLPYCTLDTTFSPAGSNGFNGYVTSLAIAGTSIYVGGGFTAYKGVANSANGLAKLNLTTGVIDTTFSPVGATANGFNSGVSALTVSGSSLYVGGSFIVYRGVAFNANYLAKLDLTTGAIDATFSPVGINSNGFNNSVYSLAASGSSLYVGGGFSNYKGVANAANRLAKLDLTSGAIDTTFSPAGVNSNGFEAGTYVFALAVSGSSLYAGGTFTAYKNVANSANYLAKLNLTTGVIDTTFSPVGATANGFGSYVNTLAVSGSSLYAGGIFTAYKGVVGSAKNFAKLDLTTGVIDTTFVAAGSNVNGFVTGAYTNSSVTSITPVGNLLYIGGDFKFYGGQSAKNLAKLDATTYSLDTTFSPAASNGVDGTVNALIVSGTSLYVGGSFTAYRGVANSANYLAKLDLTTGAIDTTFSPTGATLNGFNSGGVSALAVNGTSLYVGGGFTAYKGVANSANRLAKLNLITGVIDTTFSPVGATANGFNGLGVQVLTTSSTSLYVGGFFTAYKGVANSANRLAKLDLTTGAIDTTFSPVGATANGFTAGGTNIIYALAFSGSSLYVGGDFTDYKGVANSARRLAKINGTTGAIDTTFSPAGATSNGFDFEVRSLAASGTSLYVGGYFFSYKTDTVRNLAKLNLTTGAADLTFSPAGGTISDPYGNHVADSLVIVGSSLYVGGNFFGYRGARAFYFIPVDLITGVLGDP